MSNALHLKTKVLPGGKIELTDRNLPSGAAVDVFVLLPESRARESPSAVGVLKEAPGHRRFKTPKDVEEYLHEERSAWDR